MMAWAVFGKPNQREWVPSAMQKDSFAGNDGLYSSGYRLFQGHPADAIKMLLDGAPKASTITVQTAGENENDGEEDVAAVAAVHRLQRMTSYGRAGFCRRRIPMSG